MRAVRRAATIVLLREARAGDGPEVLLVERHGATPFMAGAHVFPGGAVDEGDRSLAERLDSAVRRVTPPAVAAIRELFEETGLLMAQVPDRPGGDLEVERERLARGEVTFEAVLNRLGAVLTPERLSFFARWVTPPVERRRYDTDFFVAPCVGVTGRASQDRSETVSLAWWTAAEALERYDRGEILLAPPTLVVLEDVAAGPASVEGAIEALRRTAARGVVEPHLLHRHPPTLVFPGDSDYPMDGAPAPPPLPGRPLRAIRRAGRWTIRRHS